MNARIMKCGKAGRLLLVTEGFQNGRRIAHEIASAPATEKGRRWLQEVETAYQMSKHGANTPNTK